MQILLVGYGAMGHEVERAAESLGHAVCGRVSPHADGADFRELTAKATAGADVAIEFSVAPRVLPHAHVYAAAGLPAVVGTTGWMQGLAEVRAAVNGAAAYLHGSNFSIGAHTFFRLVSRLAQMLDQLPDYDVVALEHHHRRKRDSPSGTALTTAQLVLDNCSRKQRLVTERLDRPPEPDELHLVSLRGGEEPGMHQVQADSRADSITIRHQARSRQGFAVGAVRAAEWLIGRSGFFSVEDYVADLLG